MRKFLLLTVGVIVSALAMSSIAQADDIQTLTTKLTPSKLDKKKYKPATIYTEILTGPNTGAAVNPEQPPSATNTKVNFPSNMKFNTKSVANCKGTEAQLQNTTTAVATDICGKKSIVSKGSVVPTSADSTTGTSAWVTIDLPGTGTTLGVAVQVTAFNGTAKDQLFLHSRADSVNNTSVLVGKIKDAPKGYGKQLNVNIPPLLAGAISRFTVTVKRGKYVQARCKSKSQKFQAITKYENHPTTTADASSKCKQK